MSSSNPIRETTPQHSAVASSSVAGDRARIPEANPFNGVSIAPIAARALAWAAAMGRVTNYLMNDCGGGRRVLKLAWAINFQTVATIPLLAVFIARYHNTGAAAWIYFAMQSSYGLVWIIKDLAFPDSNFHKRITVGAGVASLLTVLGWYWVFGWLLISAVATPAYPLPDYAWFSLCISLCILSRLIKDRPFRDDLSRIESSRPSLRCGGLVLLNRGRGFSDHI